MPISEMSLNPVILFHWALNRKIFGWGRVTGFFVIGYFDMKYHRFPSKEAQCTNSHPIFPAVYILDDGKFAVKLTFKKGRNRHNLSGRKRRRDEGLFKYLGTFDTAERAYEVAKKYAVEMYDMDEPR